MRGAAVPAPQARASSGSAAWGRHLPRMRSSQSTRFSAIIDDRQPGGPGREVDEPTNRLGLEAINAPSIALQRYEGTVLLVTHDHDLIDEVATRFWHFDEHGIADFQGIYEEWKGKHN
jgi:hypothetical protein